MFEQHNTPAKLWDCMESMSEASDDVMRPFEDQGLTDEEMSDMRELVDERVIRISQLLAKKTDAYEITCSEISREYKIAKMLYYA